MKNNPKPKKSSLKTNSNNHKKTNSNNKSNDNNNTNSSKKQMKNNPKHNNFKKKTIGLYKKTKYIIFKEDSLRSWILNIILAIIIVKFIVYPILSLLLGTSFPLVSIISGSMVHDGSFDDWWHSSIDQSTTQSDFYNSLNISYKDFKEFPMKNGFNIGDVIILTGVEPEKIEIGDIIVFHGGLSKPIIHRVVEINKYDDEYYFTTKGDHNQGIIKGEYFNEYNFSQDLIVGKATIRVPYIGWVKLGTVNFLQCLITQGKIGVNC